MRVNLRHRAQSEVPPAAGEDEHVPVRPAGIERKFPALLVEQLLCGVEQVRALEAGLAPEREVPGPCPTHGEARRVLPRSGDRARCALAAQPDEVARRGASPRLHDGEIKEQETSTDAVV